MALENVLVYRIQTGDNTYPHSGNFTVGTAGRLTIDDSDGTGDPVFGDFTHTGGGDVPDQDVTQSTVSGINVGDTVDVRYQYTVTGSDGSSGNVYFLATNSQNNYGPLIVSDFPMDPGVTYQFGTFDTDGAVRYNSLVPCFTKGTSIATEHGPTAVEQLRVGDRVQTADHGLQPVRWIGQVRLGPAELALRPELRPVRIRAGALGEGVPERDLMVSPQHRVIVRSRIAQRMFQTEEVLIPAIKLVGVEGISIDRSMDHVCYLHLMFDRHEVIFSEGAATESLFAGPQVLEHLGSAALDELTVLFPELMSGKSVPDPARPIPRRTKQMRNLVTRHQANQRPIQPQQL